MSELFEGTYERLVDGANRCVLSVLAPHMGATTLASELLVDHANPETATFAITVRQGRYSRVFFISLCGTGVTIEEQNQRPLEFVLESDALTYLQAAIISLGTKRPED